ncbi:uncharacterized protein LOC119072760 [Bradysia coprophila]|uniref:uncharacterized protein LOC119072760 n=1 Tax=Bradysia coprophila TaxID=38358 RepID=UPI00187DBD25|nr:uncharacterized protein LOC119072760 [Bradysia coprophila]XP_037033950.1 uncharacterized protein LOC119072760 [Bradysia coprophila]
MSFENEIASMETSIGNLVTATLSNIREKLFGSNDFVLADTDGNFEKFFLESAKNKIDYAYKAYLMQAKFKSLITTSNNKTAAEPQKVLVSPASLEKEKGSTALNSSSDKRKFPLVHSDIPATEKSRQLQLQNELQTTLDIVGLPLGSGDQESLVKLVKILCNHLSVPMSAEDIENVQTDGRALTVTFHKEYMKDQVLMQYQGTNLRSDELLTLLPGEIAAPVRIYQSVTEFYRRLRISAQCHINRKQICFYNITNRGLAIKFTRGGALVYVQSQYELQWQILRYETLVNKSKTSKINCSR